MAETETFVVESDGLMLDSMIWRRYRQPMPGLLERVLDINPGLANKGPWLPIGTQIMMPVEKPAATKVVPVIKLWD